jgi:hypothetical protein
MRPELTYQRHHLTILVGHVVTTVVSMHEYACIPYVNTLYTTCLLTFYRMAPRAGVPQAGPHPSCDQAAFGR